MSQINELLEQDTKSAGNPQKSLGNEAITHDYLTPQQVAEIYHVSPSAVYDWIKKKWITADKVYGKNAKKVVRYHISPIFLDEIDQLSSRLVEESKRYWMRIYVRMKQRT
jgi:predicted DNA-binding protein YlxM (UPF0122 family)